MKYYRINEEAAKQAKAAYSFSDYIPGSATAEYKESVDKAVSIAERQKALVDPMYHEKIDILLDTYARKLAENTNKGFAIEARVPSVMIAGGANFPTRQKEKQNAAREKNYEEWKRIQGILDKIRRTGNGGISADDPNAIQKLKNRLKELEQKQQIMKSVNAYYRKNKTLDGCPGLSEENIKQLEVGVASDWNYEGKPFQSYTLRNNNAKINNLKQRIESLERHQKAKYPEWKFEGGEVVANREENRLQILFDEKPDEETRDQLKHNGFHWSPKNGAWQRQLNSNSYYAIKKIKAVMETANAFNE